jgi:hypothetical protein
MLFILFIVLGSFALFSGCSDTVDSETPNVDVSLTSDTVTGISGSNPQSTILVINEVKVLLKDIKLNVANDPNKEVGNFKVGPFVIQLNLQSNINIISSAYIPQGTYDKVKFEIHKLEPNETPPDTAFADMNGRYSVVVSGTYDNNPFYFKTDASAHQKLTFPNNLVVTENYSNITLKVSPYMWFVENNIILDPNVPGNKSIIDNNIKNNINNNFKIFVDNDRNGTPD